MCEYLGRAYVYNLNKKECNEKAEFIPKTNHYNKMCIKCFKYFVYETDSSYWPVKMIIRKLDEGRYEPITKEAFEVMEEVKLYLLMG